MASGRAARGGGSAGSTSTASAGRSLRDALRTWVPSIRTRPSRIHAPTRERLTSSSLSARNRSRRFR